VLHSCLLNAWSTRLAAPACAVALLFATVGAQNSQGQYPVTSGKPHPLLNSHAAHGQSAGVPPQAVYEIHSIHDPDGIGKFYMGREIAQVMRPGGIAWLDRPDS